MRSLLAKRLLPLEDDRAYLEHIMGDERAKAVFVPNYARGTTFDFLRRYAHDPRFVREILAFYRSHRVALTVLINLQDNDTYGFFQSGYRNDWRMAAYTRDLRTFCTRWELHHLPEEIGREVVHSWCYSERLNVVRWNKPEPSPDSTVQLGLVLRHGDFDTLPSLR